MTSTKELMEYAVAAGDAIVERERNRKARLKRDWPKGSMPPAGYADWHEWAEAQELHGLKQRWCRACLTYLFPQEKCACQTQPGAEKP